MKMKKYLIMVLAIAISGVFAGCHEEEFSGSLIEQKKLTFEETFVRAFGQPDPNHHWGFKTRDTNTDVTRGDIDANGNMWTDAPTYGPTERHYKNESGETVTGDIYNYVNRVADGTWTYYTEFPDNIENYYVSQIFEGDATYRSYNDERNNNTQGYFVGSDMMDYLVIADKTPSTINRDPGTLVNEDNWFHIYDFNSANNTDYNGHMRVRNAGTLNFAYWNSKDAKFHDKWIAVDGADIDDQYKDYWYICFDFEAQPATANDNFTNISFRYPFEIDGRTDYRQANLQLPGAWTIDMAKREGITVTVNHDGTNKTFTVGSTDCLDWSVTQVSKGDKLVPGNEIYTDWIVRITKAKTNPSAPDVKTITGAPGKRYTKTGLEIVESGRVMCEDLAGANGNIDDMDYNDVVYDAIIFREYKYLCTENGILLVDEDGEPLEFPEQYDRTYANVRLMAAGGTIPVEIVVGKHNFNVHNQFSAGDNVMINTLPNTVEDRKDVRGATVIEKDPVTLVDDDGSEKLYGVGLISDIELNVLYQNVSTKLNSKDGYGAATYMFLVPLDKKLPWAKERRSFAEVYPYFPDWVQKETNTTWYNQKKPGEFYTELEGLTEPEIPEPTIEFYDNNGEGSTLEKETVSADPGTMAYPTSSETVLFNFNAEGSGPGYLCPEVTTQDGTTYDEEYVTISGTSNISAGSTIRIYGVYIDNWYIKTNFSSEISSMTGNGYIDITIDDNNVDKIQNGITIKGQNFTVTYVTVF